MRNGSEGDSTVGIRSGHGDEGEVYRIGEAW